MSDTTTEVVETEPTTEPAEGDPVEPQEPVEGEPAEPAEGENLDDLPEWARKALEKARNDAAHKRTQLKDLQTRYEGAKTPDEVEAIKQGFAREVALEKAKRTHGLTDAHDVLLTGTTAEEIEAQAKALKELAKPATPPPPAVDPADVRGGLTPKDGDPEPTDPKSLANKYGRRRY